MNEMHKIRSVSELETHNIKGVFFDIDDTFSTEGRITSNAFSSLWDLKNAGKIVVPITGRPAGWCDHIARMWPVDAVVGENGAFYFMMKNGKMIKEYTADPAQMIMYKKKLGQIREEVLLKIKGASIASDQDYREFDLAIDFCEDVAPLEREDVDRIVEIFKKYGTNVKISSIHVNGWFGAYDKLTTAKIFARKELGIDLAQENDQFIFCGDSQNDEPMFDFFNKSVGVANVALFLNRLNCPPKFITELPSGAGFSEVVARLLSK